ncbi:hypothetical protein G5I_00543 [Acromyrmex echinatior]|uniref:Uncharacterized protein n=1 Tax=Acromyrmex echinatior TaxID=103372 RepID=F4W552_ACREC|nr:hypothetical protein G5I_00543 [Acromyrmex echinatior]
MEEIRMMGEKEVDEGGQNLRPWTVTAHIASQSVRKPRTRVMAHVGMPSTPFCTTCRVQAVFWGCYIVSYTVSRHFQYAIKINSGGLVGAENTAFEKVYRF